jgi:hypothetical protein
MDVIQGEVKAYIDRMIEFKMKSTPISPYVIGVDLRIIPEDLTAETGAYEYEDEFGLFLYANGAAASQATYPELYAKWGANKWGADAGGNFLLPDTRGRTLVLCGTHADVDLGGNDGTSLSNRRPKHPHTNGVTGSITGVPSAGSLAITPDPHSHTEVYGSAVIAAAGAAVFGGQGTQASGTTSLSITGSPGAGTLGVSVGGTVGAAGGTTDAPSYIVIGSAFFRAK